MAFQLEHSVEVDVSPSFAWKYRTDVSTWDEPPASFHLDGPFASGASGTTVDPGQLPVHWRVGTIDPGRLFVIEVVLDRALLSFEWRFDFVSQRRTRMTQRILLSGDNAEAYAADIRTSFGPTLADGMKRISAALVEAERSTTNAADHR